MCIICAQIKNHKLTSAEARQNLDELHTEIDKEHIHEILKLIWQKEDEEDCQLGSD
tara:strand:+ start:473 stop:640 length:168 start_codon:yes stop_codon:yes gene_type:complete